LTYNKSGAYLNDVRKIAPWRRSALYCCVIAGFTAVAFLPSLHNGFTNWDDDAYVVDNPDVHGLTFHNLTKVFTSDYLGNYQPLPMLAYMVEHSFFHLNPAGYHLVNVLMHCVNCFLVFALMYGLSGNRFASLLTCLLFAVHPLRVESVTWIAEQKDLLSSFFYFLSLLAYIRFEKNRGRGLFGLCLLSLVFSLLSKPMAVSQPFVLLLIDYTRGVKIDKKVLLEKIPFICVVAVFAALAIVTQKSAGPVSDGPALSIIQRICVPFYGIVFYLIKTVMPLRLCAYYSVPAVLDAGMNARLLASPFLVIGGAAAVFYHAVKYSRTLAFGPLFFLITALPILQIVPIGGVLTADRYTYIPMIGICFFLVEAGQYLLRKKFKNNVVVKCAGVIAVTVAIVIAAWISHERCAVWKDGITLWSDVIAKFPGPIAYTNRGTAYSVQGNFGQALEDYSKAININPKFALAYSNRGVALKALGDYAGAIEDYTTAISLNPSYAQAYNNRGAAFCSKGEYNRAIEDYSRAVSLNPSYAQAYNNRGVAFCYKGEYDRAIQDYTRAISLNQRYTEVYYNRGLAHYYKKDYDRAIDDYGRVIAQNPAWFAQAYYNRALSYKAKGDMARALDDIGTACASGVDAACKLLTIGESRDGG